MQYSTVQFSIQYNSTSWQVFFAENRINTTHIADCAPTSSCPLHNQTEVTIIQVRHPFERLLSSYRHIFKNGGWKSLDQTWQNSPELEQRFAVTFSRSWREFITEVILGGGMGLGEAELDDLNHPGSWVTTHWAPYWYTCGVCSSLAPQLVIKTETLRWDMPEVLQALGITNTTAFPDIRVTGNDDNFSEGNRASEEFVVKYYSQLSRQEVLELYEMYRTDFTMFGYSPDEYLELSRDTFNNRGSEQRLLENS